MTVVGNTAMHHLALGVSPVGLGGAPFAPAIAEPLTLRAAELGFAMNPEGGVHFPPPIAGFVGSDCLAVIDGHAAGPDDGARGSPSTSAPTPRSPWSTTGRVVVTSCASGPAFEGYQISLRHEGRRRAPSSASPSTPTASPRDLRTIGGREPLGICGSGVVDLLAGLVAAGVVDASGRMQAHARVRAAPAGPASSTCSPQGRSGDIVFTQHDVRSLQLAKGAIAAGCKLLLAAAGARAGASSTRCSWPAPSATSSTSTTRWPSACCPPCHASASPSWATPPAWAPRWR